MSHNTKTRPLTEGPRNPAAASGPASDLSEVDRLLAKVRRLIEEKKEEEALKLLHRAKLSSPEITNARGVCMLRAGNAGRAVEVLRPLVFADAVTIRPDVPALHVTNFATALLADGNVDGCLNMLAHVRDKSNPAAERLRAAVRRWKRQLTGWERVRLVLGFSVAERPEIDFAAGEL
jgi:hypothetical protein